MSKADEALDKILEPTYGCIVYQEQVMDIVKECAGYSMARADFVRRAMSKKHEDEIEAERTNFVYGNDELNIPGAVKNGMSESKAHSIYDQMIAFGKYAFNKSHSACYAIVAYKMGYFKCYYPAEFLASCIIFEKEAKNIPLIIMDAIDNGITVKVPDVNYSYSESSGNKNVILYGLNNIKGFPELIAKQIVEEREKNGMFKDIKDFCIRTLITKANYEKLWKAGGFDSLEPNRQMISSKNKEVEQLLKLVESLKTAVKQNKDTSGYISKINDIDIPFVPENKLLALDNEYEALGVFLSGHPIDEYQTTTVSIIEATEDTEELSGCIRNLKKGTTRKGSPYYRFELTDRTGVIECVVWSDSIPVVEKNLKNGTAVRLKGSMDVNTYNDEQKLNMTVRNCVKLTTKKAIHYRIPVTHFELEWINKYCLWCKNNQETDGVRLTFLDSITGLEYLAAGTYPEVAVRELGARKILD